MARHLFGGGIADYVVQRDSGTGALILAPNATVTFWDSLVGGTQYGPAPSPDDGTGLTDKTGVGIASVKADSRGAIPEWGYGPDGVWRMAADANGGAGPRRWIYANDIGTAIDAVNTSLANAATTNTVQQFSAGKSIRIPDGDVTMQALGIYVPAGDRTSAGAPDTLAIYWNAGTDAAPNWQRTGYFNEYGELRVIPSTASRVPLRIKGQPGQTAHISEWVDINNTPLAWIEPDGRVRGPNVSVVPPFSVAGVISVGTGQHCWYNITGTQLTIRAVIASVGTAPGGQPLIIDVKRNGATIFTSQPKPAIPAGSNSSGKVTAIDVTTLNDGDYLTVDVTQVGSSTPGSDLTVQVLAY